MKLRVLAAKAIVANRELRGMRIPLIRLIFSAVAFFLSLISILLILIGFYNAGLVTAALATALLATATGLSAISTLKTVMPILQNRK